MEYEVSPQVCKGGVSFNRTPLARLVGSGDVVDLGSGETAVVSSVVHVNKAAVCVLDDGIEPRLFLFLGHQGLELVRTQEPVLPEGGVLLAEGGEWDGGVISVFGTAQGSDRKADLWVVAGGVTWVPDKDGAVGAQLFLRTTPESL